MKVKITDFFSEICLPCVQQRPAIKRLKKAHKSWDIEEINVDKNPEKAEGIEAVPTLIIKKDGKTKKVTGGPLTKKDIEMIVRRM